MAALEPRLTDLGGFVVRRLLPQRPRRMVGAWCFLDVLGPIEVNGGGALDVPPHPHIGLQTVTWLLEGEALHTDSLDSEALARPGTLNLMTSGRGIAHAEQTPVSHSSRLHAVQLWVALPDADRHREPAFDHYPERPRVELPGARATLILGELAGTPAPARTFSPLMAAELSIERGLRVTVPVDPSFEHAIVPLAGACETQEGPVATDQLLYVAPGRSELALRALGDDGARLLLLGGAPFGEPILMWWNFVARTTDEIVAAREDWQARRRFGDVRRYAGDRLDAPAFVARPVPANPMS
jgi:redox-sensitive bicupin YhaK (pirin superfamily)